MTLNELRLKVAEIAGLPKGTAVDVVDVVLRSMETGLANGEKISIMGFGTFHRATRAGWIGRDPQGGGPVEIKPLETVRFRPGKYLKAALEND
jgi:nucleoid DNA-binding protein